MYSKNIIDLDEKEDLEAIESSTRRNERLLSILNRKSYEQFKLFLSIMKETGQDAVACNGIFLFHW